MFVWENPDRSSARKYPIRFKDLGFRTAEMLQKKIKRVIRNFKIHYSETLLRPVWPWGTKLTTAFYPPMISNELRFFCTPMTAMLPFQENARRNVNNKKIPKYSVLAQTEKISILFACLVRTTWIRSRRTELINICMIRPGLKSAANNGLTNLNAWLPKGIVYAVNWEVWETIQIDAI